MISTRAIRLATRFAAYRFRELHPFEIQASVMNACNLRCRYCRCPEIATRTMDTRQWTETIRHLARLGATRIKFQGGEPTLRKDFRELTGVVQQSGVIASVTTNGQLMATRPELFDYLDEVVFSLDARDAAKNDSQRGAGVHGNVMQAIGHARAKGVRPFINMVVSTRTYDDIEALLEFCEQNGIGFHAQPVQKDWFYADSDFDDLILPDDKIRDMHVRMAQWKRAGRPLMFCAETYERTAGWPDYTRFNRITDQPSDCMAGRFYYHIEPNGDVYPCGITATAFPARNIIRDGLEDALRAAGSHTCQDCGMAYLNERKALFALKPFAVRQMLRRS